ncbi:MAG: anti-anti-sigma factor [Candidatus Fischerbacteria bacterium RBG_13_37_8]|uniref:Anti-sigma factor antagonist n=1 Tax=Candidatus Fischerbacteria bacterium RBG_13_37_8 TaxID=1817863 RepID=A0A1F5VXK5_9BACT|nr:MAG: anti-anti-sigma factor [Candidatus Fischerbacteria bacterium RBG_13_37_8]
MELSYKELGDITVVQVSGRITLGEGDVKLRDAIYNLLKENKGKIVLNLGDVSYIDSAGIGELISAYTAAKRNGAELKLLNLTKKIQDILQITQLLTIFEVFNNENEALNSFNK